MEVMAMIIVATNVNATGMPINKMILQINFSLFNILSTPYGWFLATYISKYEKSTEYSMLINSYIIAHVGFLRRLYIKQSTKSHEKSSVYCYTYEI